MLAEAVHRAVQLTNAGLLRAVQFVHRVREGNRRAAAQLVVVVSVVMLCSGGLWLASGDGEAVSAIGRAEKPSWRYLIVCGECGHRRRLAESPHDSFENRNGLFQCPQCDRFATSWYRRGGLSIPPGGWEVSQP